MKTSAEFFECFDRAGFLKPALWTPSTGLPGAGVQQSASVRYTAPTQRGLNGEVLTTDHTIRYPSTVFPGLKRGEAVTVNGLEFKVREGPTSELDGSVLEARLQKV